MKITTFSISIAVMLAGAISVGNANSDICNSSAETKSCAKLTFHSGLPKNRYRETLEAIAEEVESDFNVYLRVSHGPYIEEASSAIDYHLSFFSATYSSNTHGTFDFIVLNSATNVKPFGILVLREGKMHTRVEISFGFSEYAIIDTVSGIEFIGKDRFTGQIFTQQIR